MWNFEALIWVVQDGQTVRWVRPWSVDQMSCVGAWLVRG